jgi:predicted aspartyl protease
MYRWVDDNGDVHINTRLEDIPERFQKKAQQISQPGPAPHETCASWPTDPKGGARVAFSRDRDHILVKACINGKGPVLLIVDTGAPPTVISPRVLEEFGVNLKDAQSVPVGGVGSGVGVGRLVMVRSIQVGGAKQGPMKVIAWELGAGFADGLLGQDFMSKFIVEVDNQRGVLTLTPR